MPSHGRPWIAGVLLLLMGTGAAQAATVTPPRPGQVGFALQGQYGALAKQGELGDDFGSGAGFSIRARYRLRYERAIGISFERQGFSPRDPEPDSLFAPQSLTLIVSSLDLYQMYGTRTATVKYLSASLGLVQASQKLNDGETRVGGVGAGDALGVGVGAGLERYLFQSTALDFSFRYWAMFHQQHTNHDFQLYGGIIFYAGY
jgi:opacity protein-like surface antigen